MNHLNKKLIQNIGDVTGKKILVRCDFNVPFDENGNITDFRRIKESLKTINFLINKNAKIILCSHLGRPKGQYNEKLSLKPVAKALSNFLNKNVIMADSSIGDDAKKIVSTLNNAEVCLLENLRFYPGEETNNSEFARSLASLADVFVNDAFGTCHREHASTSGVCKYLESYCGFLIQKELSIILGALDNPKRPLISILGGSKVSDKIGVINSILEKVDTLIIGGGMSYTFTNALGYSVGTSICESDKLDLARDIMSKAKDKGVKLILPIDIKVGKEYDPNTESKIVDADKIPDDWMGLDIGPQTQKLFAEAVKSAGTVIWNGPMGVSEWDNFAQGTYAVAKTLAESQAISIIGGGDSAAAIEKLGLTDKITHISTGGGASLKLMEGKLLPGIESLDDAE